MRPVVEVAHAVKEHRGGVRALDDVSLRIDTGELLTIVGPSGSGKSSLLNIMGTLDTPTSGQVRVAGHDVALLTDRQVSALRARTIGFVFQHFHLSDAHSAVSNVMTGLFYAGTPRRERRSLALDALASVGLSHRADHRPHQLSGGERQRVAIARALVNRPSVVLADEPTGALDTATGLGVLELLRELNVGGTTIVVITHDVGVATSMPRRVALRDGRVESDTAILGGTQ